MNASILRAVILDPVSNRAVRAKECMYTEATGLVILDCSANVREEIGESTSIFSPISSTENAAAAAAAASRCC